MSPASPTRPPTSRRSATLAGAQAMALVGGMAAATHSVVNYRLWIVLVYTALAVGLAALLLRDRPGAAGSGRRVVTAGAAAGTLVLACVAHIQVHAFTYLSAHDAKLIRDGFATVAAVAALALLTPRLFRAVPGLPRLPGGPTTALAADVALGVALIGYIGLAAALIHLDRAPYIDVWSMLQRASDHLLHGENFYAAHWVGSPGVQDAFTYLPITTVILTPARWVAGDVRWGLLALTVLGALLVRALPGRRATPARRVSAAAAAATLVLLPGTCAQVELGWTEPLLLASMAGWALAVLRGRMGLAVACLAIGLASQQYLVLLLPLLAAWPRFGPRRTLASAGAAVLLVLPWVIASPRDFWRGAVSELLHAHPGRFADTLSVAAQHEFGWTAPFWLTGLLVLATLVGATLVVRRRDLGLGSVLRWSALVLLVANLVDTRAFYHQYWLVAALVLLSWAVPAEDEPGAWEPVSRSARRPAAAEA